MTTTRTNRRRFLVAASLGGAGSLAAVVAGKQVSQRLEPGAELTRQQASGYRVTEHVQKYYRTTEA